MIPPEYLAHTPEIIATIGTLTIALAFSLKTRKEIGKRDKWTCQDCGNKYRDGFMVHASHFNHDRSLPIYDSAENGRIQCVDCHQAFHELHVGSAEEIGMSEEGNKKAIEILEKTERGIYADNSH